MEYNLSTESPLTLTLHQPGTEKSRATTHIGEAASSKTVLEKDVSAVDVNAKVNDVFISCCEVLRLSFGPAYNS